MELLERLRRYVGRDDAKQLLRSATREIIRSASCRVVYFTAGGGLGKTRLQELYPQVLEPDESARGGSFSTLRISRIVDFYEYKLLSATLIEQSLINGLIQADGESKWYRLAPEEAREAFKDYDEVRLRLERLRSSGDRAALDRAGSDLRETFIACWNRLAEKLPLVMRFDTLEVLFANSAPQDALASVDASGGGVARVLQWMEHVLPRLKHTLVIMTGRPADDRTLIALLERKRLLAAPKQALAQFQRRDEIRAYLREYELDPGRENLDRVQRLTDGRPLLLACYAETRLDRLRIPPGLPELGSDITNREEFEEWLVETVLNPMSLPVPIELPTSAQTTLSWCLYFLVYARRGMTREQIRELFRQTGLPYIDQVIAHLDRQSLVKVLGDRLLLHDEIFVMLDESRRVDQMGLREPVLDFLCATSARQVHEAASYDDLVRALGDHIYYELTRDFLQGYRTYLVYVDGLISERFVNASYVLSDAFWRTLNTKVRREGEDYYPYRVMLAEAQPRLFERELVSDEQLRRLKILVANGQFEEARALSQQLYERFVAEGLITPDDQAPAGAGRPRDPYLYVDLNLLRATITQQSGTPGSFELVEQLYSHIISLLNEIRAEPADAPSSPSIELLRKRSGHFLGVAYTRRGQFRRQRQRFDEGIADAEEARRALRDYLEHPIVQPPSFLDWDVANLAQVTNNLAFMLALTGNFQRAQALSERLLREYAGRVSAYRRALFYNTSTLILIRAGQHLAAEQPSEQALVAALESGSARALGLVTQAHAQLERYRNNQRHRPDRQILDRYEEARLLFGAERSALYDLYYEWCGAARDIGKEYARAQQPQIAQEIWRQAIELADRALELLPPEPSMQRADMLERKVAVSNLMGRMDAAAALLDEAEAMMGLEMPRYGRIVSAKIAYQRGYIALFRDHDFPAAFAHGSIALARVYTFSESSHDRITFERLINEWIMWMIENGHRVELRAIGADYTARRVAVAADDLPYQRPPVQEWDPAWSKSVSFVISGIANALDE